MKLEEAQGPSKAQASPASRMTGSTLWTAETGNPPQPADHHWLHEQSFWVPCQAMTRFTVLCGQNCAWRQLASHTSAGLGSYWSFWLTIHVPLPDTSFYNQRFTWMKKILQNYNFLGRLNPSIVYNLVWMLPLQLFPHNSQSLAEKTGLPRGSVVVSPPAMQEMWVRSLGHEDPLEEEMTTYSSNLVWEISWTEEPGRLQSRGLQRVWRD